MQGVGSQPRVLIVEDEADIRALMAFVLERAGYDVVRVSAIGEARAAISWAPSIGA